MDNLAPINLRTSSNSYDSSFSQNTVSSQKNSFAQIFSNISVSSTKEIEASVSNLYKNTGILVKEGGRYQFERFHPQMSSGKITKAIEEGMVVTIKNNNGRPKFFGNGASCKLLAELKAQKQPIYLKEEDGRALLHNSPQVKFEIACK